MISTAALLLAAAPSRADVKLTHTLPAATSPGQTFDVTLYGENLNDATALWMSFPATATRLEEKKARSNQVTFRLVIPGDVPIHVGGVRVATLQGVSGLKPFLIDDLPTTIKTGKNRTIGTAQDLTFPTAVEGAIEPVQSDFYRLEAKAGQRISVEVMAQRIGSPLDPFVRLLDENGRVLVSSDDDPALGRDSRFARTIEKQGAYFLELRDIQHRGGPTYRYRLRLGDFPVVSAPFPVGVQRGTATRVAVFDPLRKIAIEKEVGVPPDHAASRYVFGVRAPEGNGSALVSLVTGSLPEPIESEPNGELAQASTVTSPTAVNGRFESPRDRDWYAFEAKQGQQLRIVGRSRCYGSPSTLLLRLYDKTGKKLAQASQTAGDERAIDFTFAAAGHYYLLAEDLHRGGGPGYVYRLTINEYRPGFALSVAADKFDAPRAGVFTAKVTCERRGYEGPITLSVEGLPPGVKLTGNVIPREKKETTLTVTLPPELPSGKPALFTIVGRADVSVVEAKTPVVKVAAVKFDRSNLGIYDGFVSDKMAGLNFAEYDVDLPQAGEYVVLLKYAAKTARPAAMKLNGKMVAERVLSQTTGDWNPATAKWFSEGAFQFKAGKNVLRLEKEGVFAHLVEVQVATRSVKQSAAGQVISATASTLAALRSAWGGWEHPPADLIGSLALGVGPVFPDFFKLSTPSRFIRVAEGGKSARLRVQAEKLRGFDDAVALAVGGLPEGVTAKIEPIAKGKSAAQITLSGTDRLGEGVHKLTVTGSATFKDQPQSIVLKDVLLRVGPPVAVTFQPTAPLKQGGTGTVKVSVVRYTDEPTPAVLRPQKLPAGLTAPSQVTIPADKNEIELELKAAADAAVGKFADAAFEVTTSIPLLRKSQPADLQSLTILFSAEELAQRSVVLEVEKFQRGNLQPFTEGSGESAIVYAADNDTKPDFAEYDVHLPAAGRYRVELRYAAASVRPVRLKINGKTVRENASPVATGGWTAAHQQWRVLGEFDFGKGNNVVRLDNDGGILPHLDKLLIARPVVRRVVHAAFDSWVVEGSTQTAQQLDGNLISVFARENSVTGKRRVGLVEFDVSSLDNLKILGAHLELAVDGRGSGLSNGTTSSLARLLPPQTSAGGLDHAAYQNLLPKSGELQAIGGFDVQQGNSVAAGEYERSDKASAADLAMLNDRLKAGAGRIALALEAREDGTKTARDWGADDTAPNGTHGGPLPPRLVLLVDGATSSDADGARQVTFTSKQFTLEVIDQP